MSAQGKQMLASYWQTDGGFLVSDAHAKSVSNSRTEGVQEISKVTQKQE
jgi:hypothetical protein